MTTTHINNNVHPFLTRHLQRLFLPIQLINVVYPVSLRGGSGTISSAEKVHRGVQLGRGRRGEDYVESAEGFGELGDETWGWS